MCCKCWRGAGPGPGRIDCGYCGAFAHIHCVDVHDEIKPMYGGNNIPSQDPSPAERGTGSDESKLWMCPFCRDSLDAENKYFRRKYEREMYRYRTVCAVIRMQAVIRSRITGVWFRRVVQAAKLIQRVVRSKQFWKAEEMKKKLIKRPVRIKLHDIDIFVKQSLVTDKGRQDRMREADKPSSRNYLRNHINWEICLFCNTRTPLGAKVLGIPVPRTLRLGRC